MRIGFYAQRFEGLGVEYVSAVLRQAGHETQVFFDPRLGRDIILHNELLFKLCDVQDLLVQEIIEADLDLVAFSVTTDDYPSALEAARKIKAVADVPTLFGGIHVTSVPERVVAEDAIDYGIVGEGEYAAVDLVEALSRGECDVDLPNVCYSRDGEFVAGPPRAPICNLDSLPYPDKDLFHKHAKGFRKRSYTVAASRGCPCMCTFCNNSLLKEMYAHLGPWHRRRSVGSLIGELTWACDRYDVNRVEFVDENFTDDKDWLEEFAEVYPREIGLPFFMWANPRYVDEEAIDALDRAGCQQISVGFQTVYESTRRTYLKRYETNEEVTAILRAARRSRIFLMTSNIVDLPGQTIEEVEDMARFYAENPVDLLFVNFLRYYPRTDIVAKALEMGIVTPEDVDRFERGEGVGAISVAQGSDAGLLVKLRVLLFLTSFLPKSWILALLKNRRYRFLPSVSVLNPFAEFACRLKGLRTGKSRFHENYSIPEYLLMWFHFVRRKVRWRTSILLGRARS